MQNMFVCPTALHGINWFAGKINRGPLPGFQFGGKSDIYVEIIAVTGFLDAANPCGHACVDRRQPIMNLFPGIQWECRLKT